MEYCSLEILQLSLQESARCSVHYVGAHIYTLTFLPSCLWLPFPLTAGSRRSRGSPSLCALCPTPSQPALQPAILVRAPGVWAACSMPCSTHACGLSCCHLAVSVVTPPFHSCLSQGVSHGGDLQQKRPPCGVWAALQLILFIFHEHTHPTKEPHVCPRWSHSPGLTSESKTHEPWNCSYEE